MVRPPAAPTDSRPVAPPEAGHVEPDVDRLVADYGGAADGPVVMLNLNRYRERAEYPDGHPDAALGRTGQEAYLAYGVVAQQAITRTGGHILWATAAHEVVIGCGHDRYDEVVAVWYPSRAAFLDLTSHPGYVEALVHRTAGLEQSVVIATAGDADPVLRSPF